MNVQMKDITVTARDGRVSHLDQVYIRGSHVRFFIVPDMLRYVLTTPYHSFFCVCLLCSEEGKADSVETLPCSVPEASAVEVLGWRVVRPRCRGLGDSGGVDLLDLLLSSLRFFVSVFISFYWRRSAFYILVITTNQPTKIRLHGIIAIHSCSPSGWFPSVSVSGRFKLLGIMRMDGYFMRGYWGTTWSDSV